MSDDERLARELERIRSLVAERHGESAQDVRSQELGRTPVDDAAAVARVNAHWGITSTLPVVGSALVLFRRVLRLTLRWYINPLVEQQNEFNQAAVRALYDLESRVEAMESRAVSGIERDPKS